MRLYGRVASVTVVGLKPDSLSADRATNTLRINRLRIRFDVKKNLGKQPNQYVIRINGLAETTRAQLEVLPLRVMLHAGYDDAPRLLFDGDLKRAIPTREGPADIVTELHVGDGHRAYAHAVLPKSYKGAVTLRQVVTDCAAAMSLAVPSVVSTSAFSVTLADFSHSGAARDALTAALNRFQYSWSIQNRQLVILTEEQVRDTQELPLNDTTGLVGSPKYKTSEKAGKGAKTELSCTSLLYPEILPGGRVRVESQFVRRSIKVTDVAHKGDTLSSGEDFLTEITGRPL